MTTEKTEEYQVAAEVEDSALEDEVAASYAEYATYVIEERALPDVRDGLKPVQRRILFTMHQNGLTSNKSHTKSARVSGNCMAEYHPHGNASIYDAMVRMAQPFTMNLNFIDGQGNFGSVSQPKAAADRYTEARMSAFGEMVTTELAHKTIPMKPNFDEVREEPEVLPAQFPSLLINGSSGIAVAMATNMAPHNPSEAIKAVLYQIDHQDQWEAVKNAATPEEAESALDTLLDNLMSIMPGPDFPTGAKIIGSDGIREAYRTGNGKLIMQAKYRIEDAGRGTKNILFYELPYGVSPMDVSNTIKENERKYFRSKRIIKDNGGKGKVEGFRIEGVTGAEDFSDKKDPVMLSISIDAKTNPDVVIAELYKRTKLQDHFGINQNCLVHGVPTVLNLPEIIQHFISFRRRIKKAHIQNQLDKAGSRLHILDGLMKVLVDIDKAISIIRNSDSQSDAQSALMKEFSIDDVQAKYVLDTALRRLTKFDSLELGHERDSLQETVAELSETVKNISKIDELVKEDLENLLKEFKKTGHDKRRSEMMNMTLAEHVKAHKTLLTQDRELTDEEVTIYIDRQGKIRHEPTSGFVTKATTTTLGKFIAITNKGRGLRISTLDAGTGRGIQGLEPGEKVITVASGNHDVIVGTKKGVAYSFQPNFPQRFDDFTVMALDEGDEIIGGSELTEPSNVVFISSDASLLRYSNDKVASKQSLNGKGVSGMKVGEGQEVITFNVIPESKVEESIVVTYTGTSIKSAPLTEYPMKGRATGGVRSHKFLKGENSLKIATAGYLPIMRDDQERRLNPQRFLTKRDSSGTKLGDVTLVSSEFAELSE